MSNKFDVNINFDSNRFGICPKCKGKVHEAITQHIQHCQSVGEIEVCTVCKNDFIKINDIFFREIL